MTAIDDHRERFTLLRPLLFTIAYEIPARRPTPTTMLQESFT